MFHRLGHNALVGGDNQQGHVDTGHAGQHVLDKALMTGDVDEAQTPPALQIQRDEAGDDSHTPLFLLGQAIGVHPGERSGQQRLSVVYVAGGTDDDMFVTHSSASFIRRAVSSRSSERMVRGSKQARSSRI